MKPPINPVRLAIPVFTAGHLGDALGLGIALQDQARKAGGDGRVLRLPDCVIVDLEGLAPTFLDQLITAFGVSATEHPHDFQISVCHRTENLPPGIVPGEHLFESLTRKFLFRLPVRAWLVSNLGGRWTAHLSSPRTDRQRIWEKAVAAGVAQRQAHVVWSETDAEALLMRYP